MLLMFGIPLEKKLKRLLPSTLGSVLFLLLYLIGGLVASLLNTYLCKDVKSRAFIGASCGVSAILTTCCLTHPMMKVPKVVSFPFHNWKVGKGIGFATLYMLMEFTFLFARQSTPPVNHIGHFVAGLCGWLVGLLIMKRESFRLLGSRNERLS